MPKKPPSRNRGRPAHVPTAATRRKVSIAAGGGMLHEQIAIALGIGTDTLRKYYEPELSVGANLRRMEVLQSQYSAAMKKGSTAAARVYLANMPQFVVPPAEPADPPAPAVTPATGAQPEAAAPAPKAPKLGKKEQAQVDATTAAQGTEWADILPSSSTRLQ